MDTYKTLIIRETKDRVSEADPDFALPVYRRVELNKIKLKNNNSKIYRFSNQ
jgi:hypothetical protein